MEHLFSRLANLAKVLVPLALLAVLAGAPARLTSIVALLILDYAAILWVGGDRKDSGRGKPVPTLALSGA